MKIKHIYVEGYKVFHNFDTDFTKGEKTQNLIVITGVNGNGKTTLLRDIIADTNVTKKPKCAITIQDDRGLNTFLLPL